MRVDDYMRSKIFEITWRNLEIQFDDSVEDYRLEIWQHGAKVGCRGHNDWLEMSRTRFETAGLVN